MDHKEGTFDLSMIQETMTDEMWVDIYDPRPDHEGEKTGMRVKVAAPDSPVYRDAVAVATDRQLSKNARKIKSGQTAGLNISAKEIDAQGVDLLMKVTLSWECFIFNGQPLDFNETNLKTIYTEPRFRFIREQVDVFLGDRRNFFTKQ